jgi:hypothetical protein
MEDESSSRDSDSESIGRNSSTGDITGKKRDQRGKWSMEQKNLSQR